METTTTDINGPTEVEEMVKAFYLKVYEDEVLRPVFEDIAQIDLESHLPKMNRFWNKLLFGSEGYEGNPFQAHVQLNMKSPLNACHFIRWLSLFRQTVDQRYSGPKAEKAKKGAEAISQSFQLRLNPESIDPLERSKYDHRYTRTSNR